MIKITNMMQNSKEKTFKHYAISFFMTFVMINGLIPAAAAQQQVSQPIPPTVNTSSAAALKIYSKQVSTMLQVAKQQYREKLIGNPKLARQFAKSKIGDGKQYRCLFKLWNSESNWRTLAKNKSSGAYGIPQALPGEKMGSVGDDWKHSYKTQVTWGLKYIKVRYDTACSAWSFKQRNGWY
jgi:hypothetical protein